MRTTRLNKMTVSMVLAGAVAAPGLVTADNVAFSTGEATVVGALAANAAATSDCGIPGATFERILTAQIANSGSPKDLVIGLSAETNLLTSTTVASKGGDKSTAWVEGAIEMCVETVSDEGTMIGAPGVVTFDKRKQELWAKLAGLNCTADLTTGLVTCLDPEEIGLLLNTTAAHHFNFVAQNPGPGAITVNAYARVTCSKSLDGTTATVVDCGNPVDSSTTGVSAAYLKKSLVAFEVQAANVH